MDVHQIHEHYWLSEGAIKSFHLDIQNNTAEIELSVRRCAKGKKQGPITLLDPCVLRLTFQGLMEVSLFDKLPTDGYYLKFSLHQDNEKEIGLSFNVHDSSNQIHEQDNWVIKAKTMVWKEV